jgi:hypothetical protein
VKHRRCAGAPGKARFGALPRARVDHTLRRNDDQFFCERVGQGSGQQSAKTVGEEIGAISAVQVQSH